MDRGVMRHLKLVAVSALVSARALAQPVPASTGSASQSEPTPADLAPALQEPVTAATPPDAATPTVTVGGYLEAYYQAHAQNPSNRLTNLRGFDNRSRTFTLSNVALDVKAESGPVTARVILQFGHTPSTYYLAETVSPGSGSVDSSNAELWKYVQQATVTAKGPRALTLEAGLFPSPIGPEVLAIKDNWNWSRSNLFFGLPFYHTGIHVSRPLGDGWTAKLHVYNGWNSVVDNNSYPATGISAGYASSKTTAQVLYLGGIERPTGALEGKAWRHLLDVLVQHAVTDRVSVMAQADAGIEPNDIGTSAWVAAALYGKVVLHPKVYGAVRADYFYERVAEDSGTKAGAIFWPTEWVASGTLTFAYQPADRVSLRLELRHDRADANAFFGGTVAGDGVTDPFVLDRETQDTATLGATAWF